MSKEGKVKRKGESSADGGWGRGEHVVEKFSEVIAGDLRVCR